MMIPKSVTDGWEAEVNDLKSALAAEREKRLEAEAKVRKLRWVIREFMDDYGKHGDFAVSIWGIGELLEALNETADKEG